MIVVNEIPSHYCEIDYIDKIIEHLKNYLNDNFFLFLIYDELNEENIQNIINQIKLNENSIKIGIHVGNEMSYDDKCYKHLDYVFRFYLPSFCDYKKIYPINIGYNSSGKNVIRFENEKKLSERKNEIYFYGQLSNRIDLKNALQNLKGKYNINFSGGFRQGKKIDEYVSDLCDSKICLVPKGFSPETFRYSESFAAGCIVITTEQIDVWYYKNSPAIFIKSWNELTDSFIENILSSDIDNLQKQNSDYYKEYLSPFANANYILSKIKIENGEKNKN